MDRPWLSVPQQANTSHLILNRNKRVFISYRRRDSADIAERLQRKLKIDFPSMFIFLDEAMMVGGEDFADRIREEIEKADIFLLLIGPFWHTSEGKSRLRQTGDVLRREIAWALRKDVPIVPLLVEDTKMPGAQQLPEELLPLAKLHAQRLRGDHFASDVGLLQASMTRILTNRELERQAYEQELEEMKRLEEQDPEAYDKKMDELFREESQHFLKYVPGKARPGEGISTPVNFFGVWEITGTFHSGKFLLRLVIEDRPGSPFYGEHKVLGRLGQVQSIHQLRGEWASVLDTESSPSLTLGLYLKYVVDGTKPEELIVPFHAKVGDDLVGTDVHGVQFVSRNVEPRTRGF